MIKNKKLMPTNDYIFKKIFGSVGSETITTSFLEAILVANFELEKHKEVKKILTEYEMREKDYGNIVLTDNIKVYILELPKIEKIKNKDNSLNLWIKFIKDLEVKKLDDSKEKDEKLEETIKAIQEAKKKYDELCQDEHACYIAELREKYVWETASVRQLGKEEGEKKRKKRRPRN